MQQQEQHKQQEGRVRKFLTPLVNLWLAAVTVYLLLKWAGVVR